jgi:ATP-dependent DNA helicase RecG
MAPTEILAEQHQAQVPPWLEPLGVDRRLAAGALRKRSARGARGPSPREAPHRGRHACALPGGGGVRAPGLAIVDEQHRFGVRSSGSRSAHKGADGRRIPHQLMMSATPIPRTLAMSYYADLDVSVIDEMPPGRTPVATKLVSEARRDEVLSACATPAPAGRPTGCAR